MKMAKLLTFGAFLISFSVCMGQSSNDVFSFLGCIYIYRQDCYYYGYSPECGTDGVTYRNRCDFSKANCDNRNMHLKHVGNCTAVDVTTKVTSAVTPMVTTTPVTPMVTGTPMVSGTPMVTKPPVITTSEKPFLSGQEAVMDFFCLQISHEDCPPDSDPICGSDTTTYANSCEFEKQRCTHRELRVFHFGSCSIA